MTIQRDPHASISLAFYFFFFKSVQSPTVRTVVHEMPENPGLYPFSIEMGRLEETLSPTKDVERI